jgi:isochorismate synthase
LSARDPAVLEASALRDDLAAALAGCDNDRILLLHVPAPVAPVEALLASDSGADGLLWAPPGDPAFAGVGVAVELRGSGEGRFAQVRAAGEALWRRLAHRALPGVEAPPTRLVGGFAFQPGVAGTRPWESFGEATFRLPRFGYARKGDAATLTLALGPDDRGDAERHLADLEAHLAALAGTAAGHCHARAASRILSRTTVEPAPWRSLIRSIREGIREGRFEKVVAARRLELEVDPAPDAVAVLRAFSEVEPACTRFALRRGRATFLGATPERLLRKRGDSLETEALAGTIRPGGPRNASRLLASGKDHHEHELVVRDLLRCLGPIARSLEYSGQPTVQSLRHALHLRTPVTATLREPHHVLDLVERLHPTPAVGGVPTRAALEWIAAHEPDGRGWYAAPFGWFDESGDGEFVVALRSGVIEGRRVHLYAGAGIVADSDADAEYAETQLKLSALLDALALGE